MKVLIVHLSDLHIKDNNLLSQCNSIVSSLDFNSEISKCLIVISGDLANSGENHQYKIVKNFIGKMITKIKEKFPKIDNHRVLIVPGNHDINFLGQERSREECRKMVDSANENSINEELKKFDNFYNFASYNRCFNTNKMVDVNIVDFGEIKIGYKLINSSLFSHYDKNENADEDKGIHLIDIKGMNDINLSDTNFNICISHYPSDWLNNNSAELLETKILNDISIIFTGHEHKRTVFNKKSVSFKNIIYSQAGEINCFNGDFSAMEFDSEKNTILIKEFEYKKEANQFVQFGTDEIENIQNNSNKLIANKNFMKDFYLDKLNLSSNLLDYFVFPRLKVKLPVNKVDKYYVSIKDLFKDLNKYSKIVINGETLSGKTTLSKKIYAFYQTNCYYPVYINASDYKSFNINTELKKIINSQYDYINVEALKIYNTIESDRKILIIDDCDKIRSDDLELILQEYETKFNKIFVIGEIERNIEIKKLLEEQINNVSNYLLLDIQPFFKDKREELIDSIITFIDKNQIYSINDYSIVRVKQILSTELTTMIYYPQYIINFAREFLSSSMIDKPNKNLFNELFENDINYQILLSAKQANMDPKAIYICLRLLAYEMNIAKKCPITTIDIMTIVNNYNADYGYSMDCNKFINVLMDSKIIKNIDANTYRFTSKKQYAYLIAKELNIRVNEGDEESGKLLLEVLENVHKYINDDIMLFLIFITERKSIINAIIQYSENIMLNKKEYSIKNDTFKFIQSSNAKITNNPNKKDHKKYIDNAVKTEERILETKKIEIEDYYDENEYQEEKLIEVEKTLAYLKLLSRCICNFYSFIKVPEKRRIVKQLYELPNKIIFEMFNEVNDNYDELVKEITDYYEKEKNKRIEVSKINLIFSNMLIIFLASEYLTIANLAVDDCTIEFLINECQNKENINYELQILTMYSCYVDSIKFNNYAMLLIKKYKTDSKYFLIERYLQLIVKNYVASSNEKNIISKMQAVINVLFDNAQKKELLSLKSSSSI